MVLCVISLQFSRVEFTANHESVPATFHCERKNKNSVILQPVSCVLFPISDNSTREGHQMEPSTSGSSQAEQTMTDVSQTNDVSKEFCYRIIPKVGSIKRPIEIEGDDVKRTCANQTKRIHLPEMDKSDVPVASVAPQLLQTFEELERQMDWYQRTQRIPPAEFIFFYQTIQQQSVDKLTYEELNIFA